jgi:UDP-3-O-[3-hydroxymyristoyl] glucosamine N-acyltransferase
MQVVFTHEELITLLQPKEVRGATTQVIRGIATLAHSKTGDLSFLGNPKYKADVATSKASAILLPVGSEDKPSEDQVFYILENPSVGLAKICLKIEQSLWPKPQPGVHPTAWISPDAKVSNSACIGPLCVIEAGAVIGDGTYLQSNVFIGHGTKVGNQCWFMPGVVISAECTIKDRVRLQPGVIIGADGFGYEFIAGKHEKVPQVGNVILENDVEIGANSAVDRARFSATVIGEGTKIDNLVQVGHNVIIGKHCIICAQCGIAGSTILEDYVVLAGQVGVSGHLTIGKGAQVGGQAGITNFVAPGSKMLGNPAQSFIAEQRLEALRRRLPELFKRVSSLEERL